jgi:Subtilase family
VAVSGAPEGWQALRPQDLPHLGDVWRRTPAERPALDPGLLWWDLTHGCASAPTGPAAMALPVLVQAREGQAAAGLSEHGLFGMPALSDSLQRLGTGFVYPENLVRLLGASHRVQLASNAAVPVAHPRAAMASLPGDAWSRPLLGVIDDGCALLNPCFSEAEPGRSRVRWLWDQDRVASSCTDGSWAATGFDYGAELTAAGFEAAHAANRKGREIDGYRAISYLVDRVGQTPLHSHGTFVAGLAAGDLGALLHPSTGYRDDGLVADAPIAFVGLPQAAITDTSGRSLAMHLLNGIRYVLSKAARAQPVVINVSLGHHGGPHDGSDLLGGALSELVAGEWNKGRPLVIATGAGNSFESRTHAHWQADAQGMPQGVAARWFWDLPAGDPTDSVMTIWSDRELNLGVTAPGGIAAPVEVAPHEAAVYWRQGRAISLVVNLPRPATGAGCMIHVAVAPTQNLGSDVGAMAGAWSLALHNPHAAPCRWDAWVDRDDAPFGWHAAPRAPSTLRDADPRVRVVSDRRTLNGLADPRVMLMASAALQDSGALCAYSASGGGRSGGDDWRPLVALPADESAAVQGLPGPGVLGGSVQRLRGTSVASALLSRQAVALLRAEPKPVDAAAFRRALLDSLSPDSSSCDELRAGAGVARTHLFSGTAVAQEQSIDTM